MIINKSIACETLEELLEIIKKLQQKKEVKFFDFHGTFNNESGHKHFSVNWVEETNEL